MSSVPAGGGVGGGGDEDPRGAARGISGGVDGGRLTIARCAKGGESRATPSRASTFGREEKSVLAACALEASAPNPIRMRAVTEAAVSVRRTAPGSTWAAPAMASCHACTVALE